MNALRNLVTELQGEQEKINNTTKELIEEHNRKQKHIDVSIFVCGLCPDTDNDSVFHSSGQLIMLFLLPSSRYRRHRHHFDYFHHHPRLLPLTSPLLSLDLNHSFPF